MACSAVIASLAAPLGASVSPTTAAAESGTRAADIVYDGSRDGFDGTIYRLYRAFFLREPDGDGIVYWIDQARYSRYPIGSIAEEFARSPEFRQRYGTLADGPFVDLVYRNVLGRAAEPEGRDYWLAQLRAGMRRGHLMLYFSDSEEFARTVGAGPFGTEDFRGPAQPAPTARCRVLRLPRPRRHRPGRTAQLAAVPPDLRRGQPCRHPVGERDRFVAMLEHALDEISEATDQDWVHVGGTTVPGRRPELPA